MSTTHPSLSPRTAANSPAAPRQLRAGPVRFTLVNGELRYLYIGDREVVRRVYFCVRFHDKWDTAFNEITRCDVTADARAGTFSIALAARAVTGPVNYGWSAHITGAADGTIVYTVRGAALAECTQIRRCGIQLLLGADSILGQPYTLTRPDGSSMKQEFPVRIDPEVLPTQFRTLHYQTRDAIDVAAEFTGTTFGYEDQRNFNDSSWKFFSAHAHTYPTLAPGVQAEAAVALRFSQLPSNLRQWTPSPLHARVGSMTGGARMPRIVESAASTPDSLFIVLNKNRPALWDAKLHTWGFTPAVNLYDDDTLMENAPAILDQIRTARVFTNPHGLDIGCRIDPVHFESLHPRPARDARNDTGYAAAWLVAFTKYAAMGAAYEIAVRLGPGPVDGIRQALAALAGRSLRSVVVSAPDHPPVEAFGVVHDDLSTTLWFANTTARSLSLPVENIAPRTYVLRRCSDRARWDETTSLVIESSGRLTLTLAPFEVSALTPA